MCDHACEALLTREPHQRFGVQGFYQRSAIELLHSVCVTDLSFWNSGPQILNWHHMAQGLKYRKHSYQAEYSKDSVVYSQELRQWPVLKVDLSWEYLEFKKPKHVVSGAWQI